MDMNNQNYFDQTNNSDAGVYSQQAQSNPYEQQNTYNQNMYNQPYYGQQNGQPVKDETVSVLDWIGTLLLPAIPCVGLIVYIIWAFSKDTKKSKSNFCKAQLIFMLIAIVIYVILIAVIMAAGASMSNYYY